MTRLHQTLSGIRNKLACFIRAFSIAKISDDVFRFLSDAKTQQIRLTTQQKEQLSETQQTRGQLQNNL
jgi:hypothetical protein